MPSRAKTSGFRFWLRPSGAERDLSAAGGFLAQKNLEGWVCRKKAAFAARYFE